MFFSGAYRLASYPAAWYVADNAGGESNTYVCGRNISSAVNGGWRGVAYQLRQQWRGKRWRNGGWRLFVKLKRNCAVAKLKVAAAWLKMAATWQSAKSAAKPINIKYGLTLAAVAQKPINVIEACKWRRQKHHLVAVAVHQSCGEKSQKYNGRGVAISEG